MMRDFGKDAQRILVENGQVVIEEGVFLRNTGDHLMDAQTYFARNGRREQ